MTELNPPSWLQDGCYTAQNDRLVTANIVCVEGVAKGLGATVTGSDRIVTIAGGGAFIEGDNTPGQGMYSVSNIGTTAVAIPPPAGNPRIDLIVARVYDSQYLGTADEWAIEVITGSPSPVPNPPALPLNAIPLYQVQTGPGTPNVTPGALTDLRESFETCGSDGEYKPRSGWFSMPTGALVAAGAGNYATTVSRTIEGLVLGPDEWVIVSATGVGTGYGSISLSATVKEASQTRLSIRFMQMGAASAQTVGVAWTTIRED